MDSGTLACTATQPDCVEFLALFSTRASDAAIADLWKPFYSSPRFWLASKELIYSRGFRNGLNFILAITI
jgi:hypothetical protein